MSIYGSAFFEVLWKSVHHTFVFDASIALESSRRSLRRVGSFLVLRTDAMVSLVFAVQDLLSRRQATNFVIEVVVCEKKEKMLGTYLGTSLGDCLDKEGKCCVRQVRFGQRALKATGTRGMYVDAFALLWVAIAARSQYQLYYLYLAGRWTSSIRERCRCVQQVAQ